MGKIVVTENMTLDGVIETEEWFDPPGSETEVDNSDVEAVLREQMKTQDALLLGRNTFEAFRGYWPHQTDDTTGITAHLNQVPKYVMSSTLEDPEWENTTVIRGDLIETVRELCNEVDEEVGVTGSITLVHDLIAAGVVDEYRLFTYPVVVGRGRRLFEDATEVPELDLVEAKPFRSGIVLLTYRPKKKSEE